MPRSLARNVTLVTAIALIVVLVQGAALAQYKVTNLTSNKAGRAVRPPDPHLLNAWGLTYGPGSPFWISDNMSGFSTLYKADGSKVPLDVAIPTASGTGQGTPTGIVFNGSNDFQVSNDKGSSGPAFFIFATLDGTISGWNPGVDLTHAVRTVNQSEHGVVYTGLAIASDLNWLYGADAANNKVDVYDGRFNLIFTFNDPTIPEGFTPYGIQVINKTVYVTFASPTGAFGGFVDSFDEFGGSMKRLINSTGVLNQPWGIAISPANFGKFSNSLLITNNLPNGTINAFSPDGHFRGRLRDINNKLITIDQIWGIVFGGGTPNNGNTNQLFFSAGPGNYENGLFGVIEAVQ
jgi:uncharacterized protein (TIGR03118 family)